MTREEAIKIIKIVLAVAEDFEIIVQGEEFTEEKCKEAVEMATEALEQEPCTDAISRKAVLDYIRDNYRRWFINDDAFMQCMSGIKDIISVTPQYTDAEIQKMQELEQAEIQKAYELGKAEQPKMGRWIRELIRNEKGGCIGAKMICSECGNDNKHDEYMSYCPNCGKKMQKKMQEVKEKDED